MQDRIVALFAGAGGLSLGFSAAGCKPTVAADINSDAACTYTDNLGTACHTLDLSTIDAKTSSLLDLKAPAFAVIGGPPCQGFSTAGGRDGSDPRNQLIFSYLDIVRSIRPRWFLFENVEGILTSNAGRSISSLVQQFVDLGYWVRLEKINFAGYGLPQARKRVLIMGNRIGAEISMPQPTHSFCAGKHKSVGGKSVSPTVEEALAGLGKAAAGKDVLVPYSSSEAQGDYDRLMRSGNPLPGCSHHFSDQKAKDVERYRLLKPGQTMKDLPPELWHESFRRRAFRRVQDGTPTQKRGGAPSGLKRLVGTYNALTITGAATREFIHPTENRPLTLREAARLQSFPDRYKFFGSPISISQQIGNAVSPMAAEILARHLIYLDGSFGSDKAAVKLRGAPRLLGFTLTEALGMSPALAKTESLLLDLCSAQHELPLLAS